MEVKKMQDITTQLNDIIKNIDNEIKTISNTINRQVTTKTYNNIELLELKKQIILNALEKINKLQ
jgi:hypothetical protein